MNYSDYSEDWRDIIRPSILKRDNYKCKHCGVQHKARAYRNTTGNYTIVDEFAEQWAKQNGKKVITIFLNVAHLDHNKQNNDPQNLLSLCPVCHSKNDKEHKKFKKITFTEKVNETKNKITTESIEENKKLIAAVKKEIRQITGVFVAIEDVKPIINLILNFKNHE